MELTLHIRSLDYAVAQTMMRDLAYRAIRGESRETRRPAKPESQPRSTVKVQPMPPNLPNPTEVIGEFGFVNLS